MVKTVAVASLLLTAAFAWAQSQVATVTSTAPFTLRGATVTPGVGVPSWPIMSGDVVKSGGAVSVVTFPDGSVMAMEPGAEAKVFLENGKPVFQLTGGVAGYSLKSLSSIKIMEADEAYTPQSLTGSFDPPQGGAAGGAAPAGSATTGHAGIVVAVVVAAAAVGLTAGITAATGGGAPVSASQPH
jgi:hypothetical protein